MVEIHYATTVSGRAAGASHHSCMSGATCATFRTECPEPTRDALQRLGNRSPRAATRAVTEIASPRSKCRVRGSRTRAPTVSPEMGVEAY